MYLPQQPLSKIGTIQNYHGALERMMYKYIVFHMKIIKKCNKENKTNTKQ
jgi:hypothetical protein